MNGAWSEQQPILAGFADEIQPLLAVVAGAVDRLVERPDDVTAATIGMAELQTLQGAVSMLEVPGFVALLGMVHERAISVCPSSCQGAAPTWRHARDVAGTRS